MFQKIRPEVARVRRTMKFTDERSRYLEDSKPKCSRSIGVLLLLYFSLSLVCFKVAFSNRDAIANFFVNTRSFFSFPNLNRQYIMGNFTSPKSMTLEAVNENLYFVYNETSLKIQEFSWFLIPLLAGSGMTWFTWMMVYIDSSIPGVQPPTPFSPSKLRSRSGHRFHSGYVLALVNGFLVFILLMIDWSSLSFV